MYAACVPKLWEATIEAHRREVRDAILDTTAALANEHGLLSVTMSQVAGETGIGRATLYKYFPDVEAILLAWHERHVAAHLEYLSGFANQPGVTAWARLVAVLDAYALIRHQHHDTDVAAFVHEDQHMARPQRQLADFLRGLVAKAAKAGEVRDDIAPDELAQYCVHALGAAATLRTKTAVHRLVAVVLAGLQPEASAISTDPPGAAEHKR
jgi:AcrR family transcriptional regulator